VLTISMKLSCEREQSAIHSPSASHGQAYLSRRQLGDVMLRMGAADVLLHRTKALLLRMAC
jgi:hypothetical protein